MGKSKMQLMYEKETGMSSQTSDCRYTSQYVLWIEKAYEQLDKDYKRIIMESFEDIK